MSEIADEFPSTATDDFGFKLIGQSIQLVPDYNEKIPFKHINNFTYAPHIGLFAASGPKTLVIGPLKSLKSDLESLKPQYETDAHNIQISKINNTQFTKDEKYLIISVNNDLKYVPIDSSSYKSITSSSFNTITLTQDIDALSPCPTNGSLIAVLTSNSELLLVSLSNKSQVSISKGVLDFSWSPKGKQIAVSKKDRTIRQLKLDGSDAALINVPEDVDGLPYAIGWLSSKQFIVLFNVESDFLDADIEPDYNEVKIYLIDHDSVENKYLFKETYDTIPTFSSIWRKADIYSSTIHKLSDSLQSLTILGSSLSVEISTVTTEEQYSPANDSERAAFPMKEESQIDVYATGLFVDTRLKSEVTDPCAGVSHADWLPSVWALGNDGKVQAWYIFHVHDLKNKSFNPIAAQEYEDELYNKANSDISPLTKSSDITSTKTANKAQDSKSLFGNSSDTNKPAFGSSVFGSTSDKPAFGSTGFGSTGFGSTSDKPAFGSTGFGSTSEKPAFGSTGFGSTSEKPAFGSTTFGSTTFGSASDKPAFGSTTFASTSDKPSFGSTSFSTSTDKPAFGSTGFGSTSDKPAFGSTTFGSASDKPAFGSTTFGSTSDKPAFGSTTFGSTTFGSTSDKPAFGSTTFGSASDKPAFGSTSLEKTSFGSTTFGAKSDKPAFGSVSFGSSSDKLAFGSTSFGTTTDKPAFGATSFGSTTDKTTFGSSPFASVASNQTNAFSGFAAKTEPFAALSEKSKNNDNPFGSAAPFKAFGQNTTTTGSPFDSLLDKNNSPLFGSEKTDDSKNENSSLKFNSFLDGVDPDIKLPKEHNFESDSGSYKEDDDEEESTEGSDDQHKDPDNLDQGPNISIHDTTESGSIDGDSKLDESNFEDDMGGDVESFHEFGDEATYDPSLEQEATFDQSTEEEVNHEDEDVDGEDEEIEDEEIEDEEIEDEEIEDEEIEEKEEAEEDSVSNDPSGSLDNDDLNDLEKELEKELILTGEEECSNDPLKPEDHIEELHDSDEELYEKARSFTEHDTAQDGEHDAKHDVKAPVSVDSGFQYEKPLHGDQGTQYEYVNFNNNGAQTDKIDFKSISIKTFEDDEVYAGEFYIPKSIPIYSTLGSVKYPKLSSNPTIQELEKIIYDTDAEIMVVEENAKNIGSFLDDHLNPEVLHTQVSLGHAYQWRLDEMEALRKIIEAQLPGASSLNSEISSKWKSLNKVNTTLSDFEKQIRSIIEKIYSLEKLNDPVILKNREISFKALSLQKNIREHYGEIVRKLRDAEQTLLALKTSANVYFDEKPSNDSVQSIISYINNITKDYSANTKKLTCEISKLNINHEKILNELFENDKQSQFSQSKWDNKNVTQLKINETTKRLSSQRYISQLLREKTVDEITLQL